MANVMIKSSPNVFVITRDNMLKCEAKSISFVLFCFVFFALSRVSYSRSHQAPGTQAIYKRTGIARVYHRKENFTSIQELVIDA